MSNRTLFQRATDTLTTGNIGIGTDTPLAPLHVSASLQTTAKALNPRDIIDNAGNYPYLSTTNKNGTVMVAAEDISPGSGEGAIYLPGLASSYLSFPNGSSVGLDENIFSADFILEAWVYYIGYGSTAYSGLICNSTLASNTYWSFGANTTGYLTFQWFPTVHQYIISQNKIPLNKWTHIAVRFVQSTKNLRLFMNGVLQTLNFASSSTTYVTGTTGTTDATLTATGVNVTANAANVIVGRTDASSTPTAYISNLRVVHGGTAPWTTTPSLALPLTSTGANTKLLLRVGESTAQTYGPVLRSPLITMGGQDFSFTDATSTYQHVAELMTTGAVSTSAFSPGGGEGSIFFRGPSSYITFPNGSDAAINNVLGADFLVEAWVNYAEVPANANNNSSYMISYGDPSAAALNWGFGMDPLQKLRFHWLNGTTHYNVSTSASLSLNVWTHIAVTYTFASKAMSLYINGVAQALTISGGTVSGTTATLTTALATVATATRDLTINQQNNQSPQLHLSNLHFMYGATQAPALTLPNTPTANSKLLLRTNTKTSFAPIYPPMGSAPLYPARAWMLASGAGAVGATPTIYGSGNVSSFVVTGAGLYTVYFTTPMPSPFFCFEGSVMYYAAGNNAVQDQMVRADVDSPYWVKVVSGYNNGSTVTRAEAYIMISVTC